MAPWLLDDWTSQILWCLWMNVNSSTALIWTQSPVLSVIFLLEIIGSMNWCDPNHQANVS